MERKDVFERGSAQQSVHQKQVGRLQITERYSTPSLFQDFEKNLGSTSGIGALEGGDWSSTHGCSFSAGTAANGGARVFTFVDGSVIDEVSVGFIETVAPSRNLS